MGTRSIIARRQEVLAEWSQQRQWRETISKLAVDYSEHFGSERSVAPTVRVGYVDTVNELGDAMRVRKTREQKQVVDYVVQYEALIERTYRAVVRYDGSYGVPHRDLLDWSGATVDQRWAADSKVVLL